MLYAKIQPQSFLDSGEEDIYVFLPYMVNFQSPFKTRLHMKFEGNWPSGFREEDI